jgi:hypothetical protein
MKVRLGDLVRSGMASRDLRPADREEISGYVRTIVAERGDGGTRTGELDLASELPGTAWRLAFSGEDLSVDAEAGPALGGGLPRDATVFIRFLPKNDELDYVLEFGKRTLGLDNLTARSRWWVAPGAGAGVVRYAYERITCDLGPFKGIPVGLFGMLKDRVCTVNTAYFDGEYWIERSASPRGDSFFNVYVRQE